MKKNNFYAHGKLLLTAEYFVLDGALALAVPTRFGQEMVIEEEVRENRLPPNRFTGPIGEWRGGTDPGRLHWVSLDQNGNTWFEGQFILPEGRMESGSDSGVGERLAQILHSISRQRPDFWTNQNLDIVTKLEFPRDWGLGSSSTLIACLAAWAEVDPYLLLADTFGGSGYDIACAFADGPILYQSGSPQDHQFAGSPVRQSISLPGSGRINLPVHQSARIRSDKSASLRMPFSGRLFFVYSGKKQDSREGIRRYHEQTAGKQDLIEKVTQLTKSMLEAADADTFGDLMAEHEQLVAEALQLKPVQEQYFPDFPGRIKSLGAWGGDFVMALSPWGEAETKAYFAGKGKDTVLTWGEMVLGGRRI